MTTMIVYGVPIALENIDADDMKSPSTDTFYLSETSSSEYAKIDKPFTFITVYDRSMHTFYNYLVFTHSMMFGPRLPPFITERITMKPTTVMMNEFMDRVKDIYASKDAGRGCVLDRDGPHWMIIQSDD